MYVLLAVLMLSLLIVAHELGHYLVARLCGIAVKEFSVGMGPLLLSRKREGKAQFSLRALPIGGYCMFYSDADAPQERGLSMNRQSVWKRIAMVAGGPLMNFAVALVVVVLYVSGLGVRTVVPRVGELEENAAAAGLQVGDELLYVNGVPVNSSNDVVNAIAAADGGSVVFTVYRGGEQVDVQLSPFYDEEAQRYRVGFSFAVERQRVPLLESVPFAVSYCVSSVRMIVDALGGMISTGRGTEDLTGLVGTVYVIQDATRSGGFEMVLELLAMISVNLGVMNLLPVPGLDGSKLIFLLGEAICGKPLPEKIETGLTMAGFALIFALMIALTYRDLMQIVTGRMWRPS